MRIAEYLLVSFWLRSDQLNNAWLFPATPFAQRTRHTKHSRLLLASVEDGDMTKIDEENKPLQDLPEIPPSWELITPSEDFNLEEEFPLPKEYFDLDLGKESHIMNILTSSESTKDEKLAALHEIESQPGLFAPGLLLQLAFYYIEAKKDLEKGAKWFSRAYFRTALDVKMSQDLSLRDLPTNFMLQTGESINDAGLDWEDFQNVLFKQAMPKVELWDRETPRDYDRRWASMHSMNTITGELMDYLPECELPELLELEYKRYRK
jgi:hypothetical protein